jgi:DNA-binding NarL/FixJ family response regulator
LQGRVYLSPSLATSASDLLNQLEDPGSTRDRLTDRQVEVLQLLAEGRSMKEAAALLDLTTRTVAFHKYRIMDSLSLHNDAEIVQYAMREHVLFS